MGLATGAVQEAFISRYRADTPLQGLIAGSAAPTWNIFDQGAVPVGQTFPYVEVFPITTQIGTALSMGQDANDVFMQMSVYTRYGGMKQARDIAKQIYDLTHQYKFSLSDGFGNALTLFENEQELELQDRITQQITHRYKLMVSG
jgi:hypothetical protein